MKYLNWSNGCETIDCVSGVLENKVFLIIVGGDKISIVQSSELIFKTHEFCSVIMTEKNWQKVINLVKEDLFTIK